ncbi:MAG: 16S rRNA (cytosine(1402)-N(4))-methyltransferase RsmH [Candidatus Pacebacteria bacterium]|nr:16S rRNA (cytosine(1402)-N(4))-methyltransferase RsmH [Candidatus Paceibacterota bacterium]
MNHVPVLQKETIQYLDPKTNENFIDCTLGGGGHTLAILEKNEPKGKVLSIDADQEIIKNFESGTSTKEFKKRLTLVNDNFANLKEIVRREKFTKVSGILFDLGMSSWHLETSGRGFSFLKQEPLDMRYDPKGPLTARKIVNFWSEPEIERILREFGEEKFSQMIAQEIVRERNVRAIESTYQLVNVIRRAVPSGYLHQKIHFATRTFQALRIAVNDELNNLEKALPQTLETVNRQGRIVVISFHSLEDRIVKNFFKQKVKENILQALNKKPITPSREEIRINPRSRSAKLRAAIKIQ